MIADGATSLVSAAIFGHTEHARLLLEAGADKNATMKDREIAFFASAEGGHLEVGHLEVVQVWLEAGTDKVTARRQTVKLR